MSKLPPPRPGSMPETPSFPRESRYTEQRRWVSWWGLLFGLIAGVGGGLFYAWNLAPVVETDTLPYQLNAESKRHYAVAIALDYRYTSDLGVAIQRLSDLYNDVGDPIQEMAVVACDLARSGYIDSSSGLRAVQTLKTFYQLQGRTGCADTLIPDPQAGPLEVTVIVPTATNTPQPPPSKTPTPFVQPSDTPEGVVIVPTTRPRLAYEGRVVDTFCDLELSGVIEIFVQDFNAQGIPGEPIRVRWEGGESVFVSGLKPERGPGYADFQMKAGTGYVVEMPALSDPLPNSLVADGCFTPNGEESVKSYRVVFTQQDENMSNKENETISELAELLEAVPGLTDKGLILYTRLWQLETWLRSMVYTEYKAKYGDNWHTQIVSHGFTNAQKNDKELTHMRTPEETKISFVTFGELRKAILNEWDLFKAYLPPKTIWEAKLEEVSQIRNRVAHFRTAHRDDLSRVLQLLRDIDEGIWRFCVSFSAWSAFFPPSNDRQDPVIFEFSDLIPYASGSIPSKSASLESRDIKANKLDICFGVVQRQWATNNVIPAGQPGFMYILRLYSIGRSYINFKEFLEGTKSIHNRITYIFLKKKNTVEIVIPSVLTTGDLIDICRTFIDVALDSLYPSPSYSALNADLDENESANEREKKQIQTIADNWPEYVLVQNTQ